MHGELFRALEPPAATHRAPFRGVDRLSVRSGASLRAVDRLSVAHGASFYAVERLSAAHGASFYTVERPSVTHGPPFRAFDRLSVAHGASFYAVERLSVTHGAPFRAVDPLSVTNGASLRALVRVSAKHGESFHVLERLSVPRRQCVRSRCAERGSLAHNHMATSTKAVSRPLAILGLPKNHVPDFIAHARHIVQAMTGNPSFPSPVPPLARVEQAIDALAEAEAETLTRAAWTVSEREQKRWALKSLLEQLCGYVQTVADADREHAGSIIEGAGMSVKKKGGPPPRHFQAKPGDNSGEVILITRKAGNRAAYEWQQSTDGGETWVSLPVTVQATTSVAGLTPASIAHFRYRTMTKDGTSDWSEPVSIRVL
jgi:hypothetical protein